MGYFNGVVDYSPGYTQRDLDEIYQGIAKAGREEIILQEFINLENKWKRNVDKAMDAFRKAVDQRNELRKELDEAIEKFNDMIDQRNAWTLTAVEVRDRYNLNISNEELKEIRKEKYEKIKSEEK